MRTFVQFRPLPLLALGIVAAACSSAPTPDASTDSSPRPAIASVSASTVDTVIPPTGDGCFRAASAGAPLEQVPCREAPIARRTIPAKFLDRAPRSAAHATVDGGVQFFVDGANDHNADVQGVLKSATGSFVSEVGGTNESDVGGTNSGPNSYSLQFNTNAFTSSLCSTSTNSACQGLEQLVYDPQQGEAYIEFSLVNYGGNCPSIFNDSYSAGSSQVCDFNSGAVGVPAVAASALTSISMKVSTTATTDTITMTINGTPYVLNQPSVLGLANGWSDAEFNIVGEDNGSQAQFNSPTSLEVQVVTVPQTPTRVAPTCPTGSPGGWSTVESNTLNLIGSCCPFGGSVTGIQYLESNISGATAPTCPHLVATPSPVPVAAGSQGYTTISVVGNLVGQTTNTALQPESCSVTGPLTSWQDGVAGEVFFFEMPSGAIQGGTFQESALCDISSVPLAIPVVAASPMFTASPNPVSVAQGSCASFTASISPSLIVPPLTVGISPTSLPSNGTMSSGGTATNGAEMFEVCPSFTTPTGTYPFTVTSSGNVPADANSTPVYVDVTACQPIPEAQACTSGANAVCGPVGNACGGTYNCGTCSGATSCSNGVCCPSGDVGSDGQCCPSGEVYLNGIGCHAPCAAGTISCPIAGTCLTPAQCTKINNGPEPPNCAKTHTCS